MATSAQEKSNNESAKNFSEEKQNKLLRLLGGKKAGNASAASEWVNKSRSATEEKNLKLGLEAQYNSSMNHRISGKARRHVGIGFEEDDLATGDQTKQSAPTECDSNRNFPTDEKSSRNRDRSRSPLRKDEKSTGNAGDRQKTDGSSSSTTIRDKKSFYMQFTKAKDS